MEPNKLFIELLQVAIGTKERLSCCPSDKEWSIIYQICLEQSVLGIAFLGVDKLHQLGYNIPIPLKLQWISDSHQIANTNLMVNKNAVEITRLFSNAGFKSCLIKGQGNAKMYPIPKSRMPGDIDLWVSGGKEDVCEFVRQQYPNAVECGWHIDYPVFKEVPVEVHFTPGYARSPKYDKRLQLFFSEHAAQQFSNKTTLDGMDGYVNVPTFIFNVVVQLSHVLRHFMIEGIGMRHMVDFYYLLLNSQSHDEDGDELAELLKHLGLYNFASAVMWVMQEVFNIEKKYFIIAPNKRKGQLLLDEILMGGNFGKYDKRKTTMMSRIWNLYPFISRVVRFAWLFPEEALLTPIEKRIK